MTHSLNLDEALIQAALAISTDNPEETDDRQTLETVIEAALREYIQRRQRHQILNLFGTLEYDDTYDHKVQRQVP